MLSTRTNTMQMPLSSLYPGAQVTIVLPEAESAVAAPSCICSMLPPSCSGAADNDSEGVVIIQFTQDASRAADQGRQQQLRLHYHPSRRWFQI